MKDKEQTKRKLIMAVSSIFKTEGYSGLGVNKVAKIAGVHKKLIYRYFGSFDNLVEQYVIETDYWMRFTEQFTSFGADPGSPGIQKMIKAILKNQFIHFANDQEMQNLMIWELTSRSDLMRSIHRTRELIGQRLFEQTDAYLNTSKINFRAVAALLVGGIYYTILHTRHNGGMFSDVDLLSENGQRDMLDAIEFMVDSGLMTSDSDLPNR